MAKRKELIGTKSTIAFPALNQLTFEAKVDTGADGSVIHVESAEKRDDVLYVKFGNGYVGSFDEFRKKRVRSSNGTVEDRFAIILKAIVGARKIEAEFSLTNRETMKFPVLIGRNILDDHFFIDTSTDADQSPNKRLSIGVLSRSKGGIYSTNRLIEEGSKRGHEMHLIDFSSCYVLVGKPTDVIYDDGTSVEKLDAVIPRIGESVTNYGSSIVRQLEVRNIFTTARSIAIVRSRDKLRSLQILSQKNIAVPKTVFAYSTIPEKAIIDQVGGVPLILKLVSGTHGRGVVIAETYKAATSVMQAFRSQSLSFIAQQFVSEAGNCDVRAFVVGSKVIAAMERQGAEGDFRSNLHMGGSAKPVTLTIAQRRLAIKAANAMGLGVAGVDMVRGKSGYQVIEVNASPGLEGIERATGINVAGEIIEYIEANITKRPRLDRIGA